MEEEEAKLPGHEKKEYSSGINQRTFPFYKLREHLGKKWSERLESYSHAEGLNDFGERKARELDEYDEMVEKLEEDEKLVKSGEMSKEGFVAAYPLQYR
ncbi:hypothetical protein AA313_de0208710 [Arthrobotrys entomopaga]|nr:hypothetical protein AA313_de0208710 [Arthrobotrys entomopaga]